MAEFKEGVSQGVAETSSKEGMDTSIGDLISPEMQEQLRRIENIIEPETPDPLPELPTAEEMDLEKSLVPSNKEAEPRKPEASSNLAETALSSPSLAEPQPQSEPAPTPEAPKKPERRVDHRRHDRSRQHARDVHAPRTAPSLRHESRKALSDLEATYKIPGTPATPQESKPAGARVPTPKEIFAKAQSQEQPTPAPTPPAVEATEPTPPQSEPTPLKPMPRKEFIKQQEELWGAKDKIKPEDVPEGEMTYEQYLAMRPVAEEGDYYHENGRIHDAVTGQQVKRAEYEEEKLHENASQARDDYYTEVGDAVMLEQAQEAAIAHNDKHDKEMTAIVKSYAEGEVLVNKDPHLKGLYELGIELQELNKQSHTRKFEKKLKDSFESKKLAFEDLFGLYEQKGYDPRALNYIADVTYATIDDPELKPIEGSAYHNGQKAKVVDFADETHPESGETKQTYTIEHEDGETLTVPSEELEFKREYASEKETGFDRVKKWFKREGQKMREYGGKAYFAGLWSSTVGNWLTNRHVTEGMTEDEVQAQKLVNRRNNLIGAGVTLLAGVVLVRTGMLIGTSLDEHSASLADAVPQGGAHGHEGLISTDAGAHHVGPHDVAGHEAAADHAQHLATHDLAGHEAAAHQQGVTVVPIIGNPEHTEVINNVSPNMGLSNAAYNVPNGGDLDTVFGKVGIDSSTWHQHAAELLAKYPQYFYDGGPDVGVGIKFPGWFPLDVRQTIESFKG